MKSLIVIRDISPVAPVHLLVIPKKHVASIMEIDRLEDSDNGKNNAYYQKNRRRP